MRIDTITYLKVSQDLVCLAGPGLPHQEFRVMMFIINRTLRFKKLKERIPYRHFTEGVLDGKGACVIAPIPSDKRTIKRAIDSLVHKGLIAVEVGKDLPGSNYFSVLLDGIKGFLSMCALNVSKKFKNKGAIGGGREHQRGGQRTPTVGGREHQPISNRREVEEGKVEEVVRTASDEVSINNIVSSVKGKHRSRRKKVAEKKEALTTKSFREAWQAGIAEYALDHEISPVAGISYKDAAIFVKSVVNIPLFKTTEWKAYVMDVLVNWDAYMQEFALSWSSNNSLPITPAFNFFLKLNAKMFASHYHDRLTGVVERRKLLSSQKVDKQSAGKDRMIEDLSTKVNALQHSLESSRVNEKKALEALRANKRTRPRPDKAKVEAALSEDLPEWVDE